MLRFDLPDIALFKQFVEKYEYVLENENKQKFLYEVKHYFPGVVSTRKDEKGINEYYIEGK